jgi:integrase
MAKSEIYLKGTGARDLHMFEDCFDSVLSKFDASAWRHPANAEIIRRYLMECLKGSAKSAGRNKRITKTSLYCQFGYLRLLSERWLDMDFDSATDKDWAQFSDNLETGVILNARNKRFGIATKTKIYNFIKKFLKWKYGDGKKYPEFCENWVIEWPKSSKEALTKAEVEKLILAAPSIRVKTLVMMLFDGGFRIEELANLKWTDLKPKDSGDYQVHIRPETSKTKTERWVTVPLSTDLINMYKTSLGKVNEDDYLFQSSYTGLYLSIQRLGEKALGKKIGPHIMRHSSATYYAPLIGSYQSFAQRYGWTLNSRAAQGYFHRVDDDLVANTVKENEVGRYKDQLDKVKAQHEIEIEQLQNEIQMLREKVRGEMEITVANIRKEFKAMLKSAPQPEDKEWS